MQKRRMYPPDGGLKEQVRRLEDTFSIWDLIREEFGFGAQMTLPLDMDAKRD